MTSPPFDVAVELFIDATWVDITTDVRFSPAPVFIDRGKTNEASHTQPTGCQIVLNNRAGKYSPRNPVGPYYGKIGRNTPIRVSRDGQTRFTGEVSSWPGRWDITATDAYVPIEAAGILRRITQGSAPVTSSLTGYYLATSPVTYWSLTDGSRSTRGYPTAGTYRGSSFRRVLGSAVFTFGVGELSSYLPKTLRINDTFPVAGNQDFMVGYCVGSDTTPDALCMEFVYKCDLDVVQGGLAAPPGGFVATFLEFGNGQWQMTFTHDGVNDDIQLSWLPPGPGSETNLGNTAALTAVSDTELHHIRLELTQDGADTDFVIYADGSSVLTGTLSSHTLSNSYAVKFAYDRTSNTTDALLNLGHVIVWENLANIPPIADTSLTAAGFAGEAAGRRIERLCGELGVPFLGSGDLDDTLAMGLQYEDYFENQITEIEGTDRGLIYEPRHTFALGYRTRASLYNQNPLATLNFNALDLAPPFEPVEDDSNIRNDVFAQRREGASFQATQETGPLSVQAPPNGVGRYKDEVPVNVETDEDLPAIAGWLLALGTVDEARYPRVTVDLRANPDPALLTAEVGYPIRIIDTERLNIYDPIDLLVLGYSETLSPFEHRITFNCVPYSPFLVNELGDADARVDPGEGSTLSAGISSSVNSFTVASAGFLWTTAGGDLPVSIMVGGEEMSVGTITGASSPQTFSNVTRSVNGVVKSHSTGAVVHLKRPGVVAL
ncbi:MAG TPA: hypothetical protein VFB74_30710 [Kribbellaceae bacterium]|nr:hypothetical protein [Kribbellaceae bacterium]